MAVKVAEYLGQRTDSNITITPVPPSQYKTSEVPCPFMSEHCIKVKKGLKPICSVWKKNNLWIVCEHRLCSTKKNIPLTYPDNVIKN